MKWPITGSTLPNASSHSLTETVESPRSVLVGMSTLKDKIHPKMAQTLILKWHQDSPRRIDHSFHTAKDMTSGTEMMLSKNSKDVLKN